MKQIALFSHVTSYINDNIQLPKRSTKYSAGYDFFAPYDIEVPPCKSVIIPTGVKCAMKEGWVLLIVPRSGFGFKTGVSLCNTVGVIDSDYYNNKNNEGHILVRLENHSVLEKPLYIKKGQAFCQGIFVPYGITLDDNVLDERQGGFGSTDAQK